jgi:hypothetical protein
MPSDHTSDLTLYCEPCIRSGWAAEFKLSARHRVGG